MQTDTRQTNFILNVRVGKTVKLKKQLKKHKPHSTIVCIRPSNEIVPLRNF